MNYLPLKDCERSRAKSLFDKIGNVKKMGLTASKMSPREDDEINRIVYVTGSEHEEICIAALVFH